jgi:molybdate transport system substrate-binding protein
MMRWLLSATLLLSTTGGALARADDVHLSAAASLTDAVEAIAADFERASGHRVLLNVAASSTLARQILAGAPVDVFFSADEAQMALVEEAGLVDPARSIAALGNTLVVVVPAGSATTTWASSRALLRVHRLAVADPVAAPAGVYARRWLTAQGLWKPLADRIVPTLNVRSALAAVETEAADAGIVYRTDAAISKRVRVAFEVPRAEGPRILFVLAPLEEARSPSTSALVRALTSASAAAVYERLGFTVLFPR